MLKREAVPRNTLELLGQLAEPAHKMGFYLAGGTALALRYGHRLSVDLGFFKSGEFKVDDVIELVSAVSEDLHVVSRSEFSVAMIADKTKVEFLRYDYEQLASVDRLDGVYLCSELDNCLMKLSAVTGRGAKKDFCDLVEIFSRTPLDDLLKSFAVKYPKSDPFLVLKSLTWFEDAEAEPDPVFLNGQSWINLKKEIVKCVAK